MKLININKRFSIRLLWKLIEENKEFFLFFTIYPGLKRQIVNIMSDYIRKLTYYEIYDIKQCYYFWNFKNLSGKLFTINIHPNSSWNEVLKLLEDSYDIKINNIIINNKSIINNLDSKLYQKNNIFIPKSLSWIEYLYRINVVFII